MKQSPIGIFDSGVGGLSLTHTIMQHLPHERVVYFGDTAHLPYGDKSAATINHYSRGICDFLLERNCKLIVIACNSASAASHAELSQRLQDKVKIIDVINPVARYLNANFTHEQIGLIGTRQTVDSDSYGLALKALDSKVKLNCIATPLLAPLVEEGLQDTNIADSALQHYLQGHAIADICALILGCTHYSLLKDKIQQLLGQHIRVIDPNAIVAQEVADSLAEQSLQATEKNGTDEFFVSDLTENFTQMAKRFFGEDVVLNHYPLWN